MRPLTSAATRVSCRGSTARRVHADIRQADGTKSLKELAAEKARPKQLLAVVELEKDTAQELTKGSL